MLIRRVARPMLAAAFVTQGMESLKSPHAAGEAARLTLEGLEKLPGSTGDGVPADPDVVAKVTAAAQIGGGLLLATGRLPRLAAATLAVSVIPANLGSHMFWDEKDPVRKSRKRRDFMMDVSLLGGLIIAAADTATTTTTITMGDAQIELSREHRCEGVTGMWDCALASEGMSMNMSLGRSKSNLRPQSYLLHSHR